MTLTVRKNGKSVETHPFLDDSINECDCAFVRILLDEHPYGAGHGEVLATWNVVMQKCNDLKDENGQQLFVLELQDVVTLQSCMKNYLTFTKKHQGMVPIRSGCDDAKPSNLLELLHLLKDDHRTGMEETQNNLRLLVITLFAFELLQVMKSSSSFRCTAFRHDDPSSIELQTDGQDLTSFHGSNSWCPSEESDLPHESAWNPTSLMNPLGLRYFIKRLNKIFVR
jgi:hypothetical protein